MSRNLSDLRSPDTTTDDRGQLLLSGAVVIAGLLVILVVVLNGAAFSDSTITHIDSEPTDRVIETVSLVESESAEILQHENTQLSTTTGNASEGVTEGLTAIGSGVATHRFRSHSEAVVVAVTSVQRGFVIRQADNAEFTSVNRSGASGSASPDGNWTVGTGNGVRNATMSVNSVPPIAKGSTLPQLQLTNASGVTFTVYIFEDPNTGRPALGTELNQSTGEPLVDCVGDGTPAQIVWEDSTIDGNNCKFTFGGEGNADPPYEIQIQNGDKITGSYQFVIGDGANAGLEPTTNGNTTVYDPTTGDPVEPTEPVAFDGAYSSTVRITSETPTLTSNTTVYSAPQEPTETPGSEAP